ncbi:MAG: ARMT1-like domain-containing protein [Desulfovibrionaceae bacterium]
MSKLPAICAARDIRFGANSYFDAWLYTVLIDNNIEYHMNTSLTASPEQVRFMVALETDQVYLPCSDSIFRLLLEEKKAPSLQSHYNRAWRIIVRLVRNVAVDTAERQRLLRFCRYRFRTYMDQHTIIPSRMVKRMTNIVFALSEQDDPWFRQRSAANQKAHKFLHSALMQGMLNAAPAGYLGEDILSMRHELDHVELARLMYLAAMARPWLDTLPSPEEIRNGFTTALTTAAVTRDLLNAGEGTKIILFLVDADGGLVFDLAVVYRLMRMGHKVILALKGGFYFYAPTIRDAVTDPVLEQYLDKGVVVEDSAISKNRLLSLLREFRLVIISDGTRERLNLYRTSTTFARAWKEADLIMAKGWRNMDVLLGTSHEFTRDILCFSINKAGAYDIRTKSHPPDVKKFSEQALIAKAEALIEAMRAARRQGKTVMFYSCIIGSIPGQVSTAIELVQTFIARLRRKLADTYIVNPTEHFEDGLDGDDLMFMWERVQRSGYIDVWRFQTVEDIEASFALLKRKVPPAWSGKDATYSTGCTKEMQIAMDMQARNGEMQIIGPAAEKFFRRSEYGVGKYSDVKIGGR